MGTVVAAWTESFLAYAESRGMSRRDMLGRAGIRSSELEKVEGRVSASLDPALWRHVQSELGGEHLGLEFARAGMGDASLGVVGLLARPCETVADALETAVDYHSLIKD